MDREAIESKLRINTQPLLHGRPINEGGVNLNIVLMDDRSGLPAIKKPSIVPRTVMTALLDGKEIGLEMLI